MISLSIIPCYHCNVNFRYQRLIFDFCKKRRCQAFSNWNYSLELKNVVNQEKEKAEPPRRETRWLSTRFILFYNATVINLRHQWCLSLILAIVKKRLLMEHPS